MKRFELELGDFSIKDIKRLIAEGTRGADGKIAAIENETWPMWMGAAVAHLQMIIEQAESNRK